jgi:hypothetical protein
MMIDNRDLQLTIWVLTLATKSIVTSKKYHKALSLIHFSLSGALNNEALLPQSRNIP